MAVGLGLGLGRGAGRGWAAWRWRGGGAAALALLVLVARLPLRARLEGAIRRAPPHALAAHLADFNNLHAFYDHIESWWVEEQWSNYTSWRYTARFACGARCSGHAHVTTHDSYAGAGAEAGVPQHGAKALSHRVLLELSTCRTLPLLPWPSFCEDLSVEASVRGDGAAGSRYVEAAEARAPLLVALLGGRGAALRAERQAYWRALQAAFA